MNIKLFYSALLIAGTMGTAYAQETVDTATVRKIREEGLNHSKVMETAFYLTDVSGPRISGSPELKHAQEWAVSQLKSWGLVNAAREPWGKFGKGWEVQKNYAAITAPYYHAIIAIPKAWTPGTNGPIKAGVVVIKADSVTDLDKYKGKLRGKVVMMDVKGNIEDTFRPDASRLTDSALNAMANSTGAPAGGQRRPQAGGGRGALRGALTLRQAIGK